MSQRVNTFNFGTKGYLFAIAIFIAFSITVLIFLRVKALFGVSGSYEHYASGGTYPGHNAIVFDNGHKLLFSSPRSGHGDIYSLDIATGQEICLTNSKDYDGEASPSKTGHKIVYVNEANGTSHIWIMDSNGNNKRQLTAGEFNDRNPFFSPDERKIAFDRKSLGSSIPSVFEMDVEGRTIRQISQKGFGAGSPTYSPDGLFLYARSDGIIKFDLLSGGYIKLGDGDAPRPSPDGLHLAIKSGEYDDVVSIMDTTTGVKKDIVKPGEYIDTVAFDDSGSDLYYFSGKDIRGLAGEMWKVSLDGKTKKLIATLTK